MFVIFIYLFSDVANEKQKNCNNKCHFLGLIKFTFAFEMKLLLCYGNIPLSGTSMNDGTHNAHNIYVHRFLWILINSINNQVTWNVWRKKVADFDICIYKLVHNWQHTELTGTNRAFSRAHNRMSLRLARKAMSVVI